MIYSFITLFFCLTGLSSCSVYERQRTPVSWCGTIQSVEKQKDGRYAYILRSQHSSAREIVMLIHPHSFPPKTTVCLEGETVSKE